MTLPLSDVRIIAIEQYAAGPYGSLHLADLGADVIKIEQPPDGDVGREVPPYRAEHDSLFFQAFNRNKRSVCLNLADPGGRAVLEDLVRASDALYSNLRGDVPAKLEIRYDDLKHINPTIVCCFLSGYGMTGPRATQPGFDYMVQGLAGWMTLTGEPDAPPTKTGMSAVDFSTGLAAALATVVAIHAARRDGRGGDCDVALLDTALSMLNYLATWAASRDYDPGRIPRSGHPTLVPFGNFPTKDGWVVAGGSKEKFWRLLARAIGLAELVQDPRFRTFETRLEHRDELTALLDAVFVTKTTAEWLERLVQAGVPCAPINTVRQALEDPQVAARELITHRRHPQLGSVAHIASPVRVGSGRAPLRNAPGLGADTRDVLTGLLGYSEDRVRQLADRGAIAGPRL